MVQPQKKLNRILNGLIPVRPLVIARAFHVGMPVSGLHGCGSEDLVSLIEKVFCAAKLDQAGARRVRSQLFYQLHRKLPVPGESSRAV